VNGEGTRMANDTSGHNRHRIRRWRNDTDDHHERGEYYALDRMSGMPGRSASGELPSVTEVSWRFAITAISSYFFLVGLVALVLKVTS
jgi:hypothetical protein